MQVGAQVLSFPSVLAKIIVRIVVFEPKLVIAFNTSKPTIRGNCLVIVVYVQFDENRRAAGALNPMLDNKLQGTYRGERRVDPWRLRTRPGLQEG